MYSTEVLKLNYSNRSLVNRFSPSKAHYFITQTFLSCSNSDPHSPPFDPLSPPTTVLKLMRFVPKNENVNRIDRKFAIDQHIRLTGLLRFVDCTCSLKVCHSW